MVVFNPLNYHTSYGMGQYKCKKGAYASRLHVGLLNKLDIVGQKNRLTCRPRVATGCATKKLLEGCPVAVLELSSTQYACEVVAQDCSGQYFASEAQFVGQT